ncbi:DUF6375 family protein [Rhodoferax sp.]|uniref:DUF6375 family protein n=1 Tax=Rhodoferax sp. TaxID=50421 RepID=UPI0025DF067A|nr:DUF6375 family protein [Rhodoferax sp.]
MNLVLIGKFQRAQDAEKVERDIGKLSAQASKDDSHTIAFDGPADQRFSDEMLSLLGKLNLNTLGPADLSQLVSDHHLERKDDRITVTTDEAEVSAFVKLFIEAGAKVEIFSAHDYPSDSPDAS